MTDYTKLVEALRYCADRAGMVNCNTICEYGWKDSYGCKNILVTDAAAAIEALLKENKELIEDHPEMVEADGHWEWRKPNGEVLMPKRGEWIGVAPDTDTVQCSVCGYNLYSEELETPYCPWCGAKMEVQE